MTRDLSLRLEAHLLEQRTRFLDRHQADWLGRAFSAANLSYLRATEAVSRAHVRGRVLDAGCGRGVWRRLVVALGADYVGLDLDSRGGHRPDLVGDVQNMALVAPASFDTVICHQVLEHVPEPDRAAREIGRVLRPGGLAIVSVPHLSRYHELPHDYFRFTSEGLRVVFERSGFTTVEIRGYGGPLGFLHHQASSVLLGLLLGIPGVGLAACVANAPVSMLLSALDRLWAPRRLPLGIVGVFRRAAVP